ncbi:hypothetical protein [Streptomyces nondiastaticus]|uniref:Uncharacterized protein n=1 Tax=Streptomyces nondiastaticus TaxID=3154512 RepID=A0ABW6TVW4_9ACTN
MSERTGGWKGEGYELSPEQNRVVTRRWEQAAAARDRMDAMMKDVQQETARSHGGKLQGLEYSLKDVDSFRRKAATAAKEDKVPVEKTARKVNDLNRYTLTFEPDSYAEGVERTYERLREQGYEPTAEKNTWQDPVYKGVNTTWQHAQSEEKFELQFHTPDSFKAKMENHELYEISRSNDIDELAQGDEELARSYRNAANHLQNERYKNVKIPPGQERIGEQLIRDELKPVPAEHVELIRKKEAEKRAENEAKALAKAEAKKQAEQAALGLDGPAQAESQGLRNKLATKTAAPQARQSAATPRIEPLRAQSRGRGPSLT